MGGLSESGYFEVLGYWGEELTLKIGCSMLHHYLSGTIVFQYIQPLLSEHPA